MSDPIVILRRVSGGLLLTATALALALAATGKEPRALLLAGLLWSLYGLGRAVTGGFLTPAMDWFGGLLANGGTMRRAAGHSEIEALAVQGRFQDAAERWYREAVDGDAPAAAMLRRAELLAGPLTDPGAAAAELTQYRDLPRRPLTASEDVAIGLALVELYERRLDDPARAMFELRRLLDRHPESRHVRRIRNTLVDLKERRFGDAYETPETKR
jgi:hypothetical protein